MTSILLEPKTEHKIYHPHQLAQLKKGPFPENIALIMDGNRRWAKKEGLPPISGHWRGAETLTRIVQAARELGVKVLTVYGFSTENWKRSPLEIKALMRVFKAYLVRQRAEMVAEGVRLNVIGDLTKFPKDVQKTLADSLEATKNGDNLDLVVALNYGARDEMKRAIQKIVEDCIEKEEISEALISSYLDTARWKDPDLLIRPSGESRLSNFLLWQASYSEVIFTETYWPAFNEIDLLNAVLEYQRRELRLGK